MTGFNVTIRPISKFDIKMLNLDAWPLYIELAVMDQLTYVGIVNGNDYKS